MLVENQPRAVVGSENDHRVFAQAFLLQHLHDLADAIINFLDDIAIKAARTFAFETLGGEKRDVRHAVSQVKKERPVPFLLDEPDRFLNVAFGNCRLLRRALDDFGVAHERHIVVLHARIHCLLLGDLADFVHVVAVRYAEIIFKAVAYPCVFSASAKVISPGGKPPAESGKSTPRLSLIMPERMGRRPVSSPARLGVQTLEAA